MKLSAMVGLAILLGPVGMAAQSSGGSFSTLTAQRSATMCPVSLHAQHQADGGMTRVGSPGYHMVGQSLYLELQDPKSSPIVKATMTIHGYSDKARITQAAKNGADAELKMTVNFRTLPSGAASGNVRVPGMTAVTRIDLEAVSYADGEVQVLTEKRACQVTPDPFMLVAGR